MVKGTKKFKWFRDIVCRTFIENDIMGQITLSGNSCYVSLDNWVIKSRLSNRNNHGIVEMVIVNKTTKLEYPVVYKHPIEWSNIGHIVDNLKSIVDTLKDFIKQDSFKVANRYYLMSDGKCEKIFEAHLRFAVNQENMLKPEIEFVEIAK